MIKVDENDPIGETESQFPYRDVKIQRSVKVREQYDMIEEIGRGKFGTVLKCKERTTGMLLAAKFVSICRKEDRRSVEREIDIMQALQHPRLLQLYDAFEDSSRKEMCIVLELIEGGELFERVIDDDFVLTEKACAVFMRQICEGMEFMHSSNILHLDMKPENILCLTRTGNRIKLIDFGLARRYEPSKKLQVLFGTPEFVAPEVVNFEPISYGTDMWSLGVICYVLLSGLSPFMGNTDVETMANVTIAKYDFDDEAFDNISTEAKDFIMKLLVKDKDVRMSATQCLAHLWLLRPPQPTAVNGNKYTELEVAKENLRCFVERWSEHPNSPYNVNSPWCALSLHKYPGNEPCMSMGGMSPSPRPSLTSSPSDSPLLSPKDQQYFNYVFDWSRKSSVEESESPLRHSVHEISKCPTLLTLADEIKQISEKLIEINSPKAFVKDKSHITETIYAGNPSPSQFNRALHFQWPNPPTSSTDTISASLYSPIVEQPIDSLPLTTFTLPTNNNVKILPLFTHNNVNDSLHNCIVDTLPISRIKSITNNINILTPINLTDTDNKIPISILTPPTPDVPVDDTPRQLYTHTNPLATFLQQTQTMSNCPSISGTDTPMFTTPSPISSPSPILVSHHPFLSPRTSASPNGPPSSQSTSRSSTNTTNSSCSISAPPSPSKTPDREILHDNAFHDLSLISLIHKLHGPSETNQPSLKNGLSNGFGNSLNYNAPLDRKAISLEWSQKFSIVQGSNGVANTSCQETKKYIFGDIANSQKIISK